MPRRWIIRATFLLPILLCLAGWLWSSTHEMGVAYGYEDRNVYLWTRAGALNFQLTVGVSASGWLWLNEPLNSPEFWPSKTASYATSFLGFSYLWSDWSQRPYARFFAVPYWFLLVVSGGVFACVWRKTRRKPDSKTAFPIEVAAVNGRGQAAAPKNPSPS